MLCPKCRDCLPLLLDNEPFVDENIARGRPIKHHNDLKDLSIAATSLNCYLCQFLWDDLPEKAKSDARLNTGYSYWTEIFVTEDIREQVRGMLSASLSISGFLNDYFSASVRFTVDPISGETDSIYARHNDFLN